MEFITDNVGQLNWWVIVVATLSTMPIGYAWYDLTIGFGKRWAKLNGLSEKELGSGKGMGMTFAVMLATSFVTAFLIACFIKALGIDTLLAGLGLGLLLGVVFRGGAHFIHNGFTRKPMELTLIDVGHDTVSLSVMAIVIALWQ